jgi:hypothetical protein
LANIPRDVAKKPAELALEVKEFCEEVEKATRDARRKGTFEIALGDRFDRSA